SMFGHKPYAVIADHLNKNGIAVFRYDERGVGKSKGIFDTTSIQTFQADLIAAINYLVKDKDVYTQNLGLLGHSIGGIVAPRTSVRNNKVSRPVLMAAPGNEGVRLMRDQKARVEQHYGWSAAAIKQARQLVQSSCDVSKEAPWPIP